uniref:Cyclin dependent kinase 2 associated protein 1 n=1 Tax=Sarcophilus harrisii TaxID=9305 RepID=A0A7N4V6J5_SARHA
MSYKPNLNAHMPGASLNPGGSVHSPSASMAASTQYRQLINDYGPPSLGYTQGTGSSQVPQSKYAELLAIIEELGKEIRPTYAGSKSAMERLKRGKCRPARGPSDQAGHCSSLALSCTEQPRMAPAPSSPRESGSWDTNPCLGSGRDPARGGSVI